MPHNYHQTTVEAALATRCYLGRGQGGLPASHMLPLRTPGEDGQGNVNVKDVLQAVVGLPS